jgi:hypothetical protein
VEQNEARAANSVCSLPGNRVPRDASRRGEPLAGEGGHDCTLYLFVCPLPSPPAEVGCFRLRPVNKWPNSGKPEFGCKRGRGRTEFAALLSYQRVTCRRIIANAFAWSGIIERRTPSAPSPFTAELG